MIVEWLSWFVIGGWILSAMLIAYAVYKYRYFPQFEAFVLLSWFFIFFRPLYINDCPVNISLYYWDADLYVEGAVLSIIMLLIMQLGASTLPRRYFSPTRFLCDEYVLNSELKVIAGFLMALMLLIVALMYAQFGLSILPMFRGGGALSVALPGAEKYFYVLGPVFYILATVSLFLMIVFKEKKYIFYFLIAVLVMLVFSKRGAVIGPIIGFLSLLSLYHVKVNRGRLFGIVDVKLLLVLSLVLVVAFFGKVLLNPLANVVVVKSNMKPVCKVIVTGQQEFDLFWPAVLKVSDEKLQAIDWPFALLGGVLLSHKERLLHSDEMFHSATDKLMLEFNRDVYVNQKFGISPNFFQYMYFYLGVFSMLMMFFFGLFYRYMEPVVFKLFIRGKVISSYFVILFIGFAFSPHDFTLKYFLFKAVIVGVIILFYIMYRNLRTYSLEKNNGCM